MERTLGLISKEQMAFGGDAKMATNGFADWLIALKNKIDHLDRARAKRRFEPEIAKAFANELGTLRHDGNHVTRTRNEIKTKVDQCFTKVVH